MKTPVDKLLEVSQTSNETGSLKTNNQQSISIDVGDAWDHRLLAKKNKFQKRIWYIYAVTISLVLVGAAGIYLQALNDRFIEVVASNNIIEHLMPDGSRVWIKPGSVLSYQQSFGTKNRALNLNGTGFFEIKKNEESSFTISSTQSTVKVVEASFLYETDLKPNVQVFTGSVKFENKGAGTFEKVEKGQTATMTNSNSFEFSSFDQNSISWKTGKLVFEDEDLKQVLESISHLYKVELYTSKHSPVNITATFDNLSLEEVISALNEMVEFNIKARLK